MSDIGDPQTGQVHLERVLTNNIPEYAGKFWLYDNQLIEQELSSVTDTDNEPQPSYVAGRC